MLCSVRRKGIGLVQKHVSLCDLAVSLQSKSLTQRRKEAVGRLAGWKPAIQQIGNLRYGAGGAADGNKLNRAHQRRPAPAKRQQASRSSRQFSGSLWQIKTSPPPQPQSNFTAQKRMSWAAATARARLRIRSVN